MNWNTPEDYLQWLKQALVCHIKNKPLLKHGREGMTEKYRLNTHRTWITMFKSEISRIESIIRVREQFRVIDTCEPCVMTFKKVA